MEGCVYIEEGCIYNYFHEGILNRHAGLDQPLIRTCVIYQFLTRKRLLLSQNLIRT